MWRPYPVLSSLSHVYNWWCNYVDLAAPLHTECLPYERFFNQEWLKYVKQCYLSYLATDLAVLLFLYSLIENAKVYEYANWKMDDCPHPLTYYTPHPFPSWNKKSDRLHIYAYYWTIICLMGLWHHYAHTCTLPTRTYKRSTKLKLSV